MLTKIPAAMVGDDVAKQSDLASLLPPGVVLEYAGTTAPPGFLLCYGQAVSRTTYAALFAAIGTTHGAGDGSTTFNLPDRRGRVAVGKDDMGGAAANRITSAGSGINGATLGATGGTESVTLTAAQVPNNQTGSPNLTTGTTAVTMVQNAAHTGSASQAHNNVQPTIVQNFIVKT